MNAYPAVQTSGYQWSQSIRPMLHQDLDRGHAHRWPPAVVARPMGTAIFDGPKRLLAIREAGRATFWELRRHFVLPKDSSVTTFLAEHRTLVQILLESVGHLKSCFGEDAVFNLRALVDESGSHTLYAVAMWPGSTQLVRKALADFDEGWWIPHSRSASGYLTFTYELV